MKPYEIYQYLDGQMHERDVRERDSKFWGIGKWNNFVLPLLPEDCSELTLIDVGCNAGLHCMLAEQKGFKKVIGIDSNLGAIQKGTEFKEKNGFKYELFLENIESYIDKAPVADYTVLINAHYYFSISGWLDYLDKLKAKSRYVLIVTTKQKNKTHLASADIHYLDEYFKDWEKLDGIDVMSEEGDPSPRKLWTRLYKSPILDRVKFEGLENFNDQKQFYKELDGGVAPMDTVYGQHIKRFRRKQWKPCKISDFIHEKAILYEDVKEYGIKRPMVLNRKNKVVDGSHRYIMLQHLGEKSGIFRRVR